MGVVWGTGQVLWSLMWFTLFVVWVYLLILVFADIFRSRDLSGVAKFLWVFFVIVLPYIGVFTYILMRGDRIAVHSLGR